MISYSTAYKIVKNMEGLSPSYFKRMVQDNKEELLLKREPWFDCSEKEFAKLWASFRKENFRLQAPDNTIHPLHMKPWWNELLIDAAYMPLRKLSEKYGASRSHINNALKMWDTKYPNGFDFLNKDISEQIKLKKLK